MDENRVNFEENPFHYHEGASDDDIINGLTRVLNLGMSEYEKSLSSGELENISIIRSNIAREIGKFFTHTLPTKENFLKVRYLLSHIFGIDAEGKLQDISRISSDNLREALVVVKVTSNCKVFDEKILEIKNLLGLSEDIPMENIKEISLDHLNEDALPNLHKVYKLTGSLYSKFDYGQNRIIRKLSTLSLARIKTINNQGASLSIPPQNVKGKLSQFSQAKIEKILAINLAQIHDMLGLEYPELTIENAQNAIDKISWLCYPIRELRSIEKKLSYIYRKNKNILPGSMIDMFTKMIQQIHATILNKSSIKISNKQEIRNWINNIEKYLVTIDVAYQQLLQCKNDETNSFKEKVKSFRLHMFQQYEELIILSFGLDDTKKAVTLDKWERKKTIRSLLEETIAWGQLYGPIGMSEEDFFVLCEQGSILHDMHTIANRFTQEWTNLFPQKKERVGERDILVSAYNDKNTDKQRKRMFSPRKTLREVHQEISDMKKRIEQYASTYDHMDLAKKVCNDLLEKIEGLSPREGSDDTKKIQELVERTNKQLDIIKQRKKERVNLLTGSSSSNTDENKNNVPSKLPEDEIDRRTGRPKWNIDIGL